MNRPMSDGDFPYDNVDPYNHQDRYDEGDDLMTEPTNDGMCPDVAVDAENVETVALYRRDFLRNASKIGLAGAVGLLLGIGKFKGASADTCTALYETRTSSSCQTGRSCWRRYRCKDANGIIYYTAWVRIYCGSCGAPCPPNC